MPLMIGFTGTRSGMSSLQLPTVRGVVAGLAFLQQRVAAHRHVYGLHGDCVGADLHFDQVCRELGLTRHYWPCSFDGNADHSLRAYTGRIGPDMSPAAIQFGEALNPAKRNQGIVDAATVMIATPPTAMPVKGGTWMTIRMTRKARKPLFLVLPDGDLIVEGGV